MNSSPAPLPTTAEDKLNWEVEKIKVEIANLRKPWIASPASWIALITTMVALAGFFTQYNQSVLDAKVAEAKKIEAKNELEAAKADRKKVMEEMDSLKKQVAGLKVEANSVKAFLAQMQTEKSLAANSSLFAQAQEKLQSLGNSIDDVASNLMKPGEENIANADKVKIYMQIGRETQRNGAMQVQAMLKEKGFTATQAIENVQGKASVPKVTELRYFSPTNKEIAETITELIKGQNVGSPVVAKYVSIPGGNKRLIEVWFALTAFK